MSISSMVNKALRDNRITLTEVNKIINTAKTGGLTASEKTSLTRVLDRYASKMDADAKAKLQDFLGIQTQPETPVDQPETVTPDAPTAGDDTAVKSTASDVQTLGDLATSFKKDFDGQREAIASGSREDGERKTLTLFEDYGNRLVALAAGASADEVSQARTSLMNAYQGTGLSGAGRADTDGDKLSDADEILRGTNRTAVDSDNDGMGDGFEVEHDLNPADAQRSIKADHKPWTTTYWPMAGDGRNSDGSPESHLWAKDGALDKLDTLRRTRGDEAGAKALEFERQPALNWLVGDSKKGEYIPNSSLKERDAEVTTGVDFDGDGKITAGVKADFLDARGDFAAVRDRSAFVPKLGDETLTRHVLKNDDGSSRVEYRHANGTALTADEAKNVVLTNPSADGKTDGTMDVGWWGSCDKVALAGILFQDPKHSVTLDGVTFTPLDIRGLLTVLADSQAKGTDFEGARYDERPDILVTKDGQQLMGTVLNQDDPAFRTKDMWRWDGDFMVLNSVDKDIEFRTMDGETKTFKAADIKHLAREDKADMSAINFHTTMLKWLGTDKRSAAMDRDPGSHVWNYNFHSMDFSRIEEMTNKPTEPGFNGPAGDGRIMRYDGSVKFGDSDYSGKNYSYWIEYDKAGQPVNSGWMSENPDFLWRPAEFRNWTGANPRNPYVTPELVKEIYEKSIQ